MKLTLMSCRVLLFALCLIAPLELTTSAQERDAAEKFRAERHHEFTDPKTSPLELDAVPKFKGLNYFKVTPRFRLQARFIRTPNEKKFKMPTSSGQTKVYLKYGELRFKLENKEHALGVYQSEALAKTEKYQNYLLIPFTDMTNGKATYGGGRYIDFDIPSTEIVILDFNLAYNPSCAYSNRYNCPIPPKENRISTKIKAGEKAYRKSLTQVVGAH